MDLSAPAKPCNSVSRAADGESARTVSRMAKGSRSPQQAGEVHSSELEMMLIAQVTVMFPKRAHPAIDRRFILPYPPNRVLSRPDLALFVALR